MPTGSGSRTGGGTSALIQHVSTLQNLVVGKDDRRKSKSRNSKRPRASGLERLDTKALAWLCGVVAAPQLYGGWRRWYERRHGLPTVPADC